jgi:RNA polymerase sigma factor (sigma-70 family)
MMQPERLQELFDALSGPLVLYARGWCDQPDDAVQEAFIDLSRCSVEPHSPQAWLYKTTRRKAQNIARAEGRRQKYQQLASQEHQEQTGWFDETRYSSELAVGDVVQALQCLSTEERELVVARVWGQLGFEQLADLLECSASSAHRRYLAALSRLKTLMLNQSSKEQPSKEKPPRRCVDGVES